MSSETESRENFDFVIDDDDLFSPERQKTTLINSVRDNVCGFIKDLESRVDKVPQSCRAILQDGSHYEVRIPLVAREILPEYQEHASVLFSEIGEIVHEKGFRFAPSLSTPREHKECGSSGYGGDYWDEDPDVPVPLLTDRLIAKGIMKPEENRCGAPNYTYEEIDRARRLIGWTRLDLETGRVTDEIDAEATNDSYFFLSPERRREIIFREQEILQELTDIASAGFKYYQPVAGIVDAIARYMEGKITSPEMLQLHDSLVKSRGNLLDFSESIKQAKQLAYETGRWDHILTPQEILLRFEAEVDSKYLASPYTPLAIQDGLSIEEVVRLREGEQTMVITTGILDYEMPFCVSLELLDQQGDTIQSPTLLNHRDGMLLSLEVMKLYKDYINVPFSRSEDWYYRDPQKAKSL